MASNNLVTKGFLKSHLKQEFKIFRKEFKKELMDDFIAFMETSLIPLLETMDKKLDDVISLTNTHERRLDKHDDKFLQIRAGT